MKLEFKAKSVAVKGPSPHLNQIEIVLEADSDDIIAAMGLDEAMANHGVDEILECLAVKDVLDQIGEDAVKNHFGLVKPTEGGAQ